MIKIALLVLALCSSVPFVLGTPTPLRAFSRDSHERHAHGRSHKRASLTARGNDTGPAEERELAKRFSGSRWTNYNAGLGACGKTNSNSDFIVALNSAQYGSGQQCFKMITMSYGGKTAQAQIVDECPGCLYSGLDLAPSLFAFFASLDEGVIYGSWDFGNASPGPTSSSQLAMVISVAQYTPSSSNPSTPTPASSSTSSFTPITTSTSSMTIMSTTSSNVTITTLSSQSSSAPTAAPTAKTDNSLINAMNLAIVQMAGLVANGAQVPIKFTVG